MAIYGTIGDGGPAVTDMTLYADTPDGTGMKLSSLSGTVGTLAYCLNSDGAGTEALWIIRPSTEAVDHVTVEAVADSSVKRWVIFYQL